MENYIDYLKQIIELQNRTISTTIDLFVHQCECYLNYNQDNLDGYLDMSDIRAIAKQMKGDQTKRITHKCYEVK